MVNYYLRVLSPYAQKEGKNILLTGLHRQMSHLLETTSSRTFHPSQMYEMFMPHTYAFLCTQLSDTAAAATTDGSGHSGEAGFTLPSEVVAFVEENCGVVNVQEADVGFKESVDKALTVRALCLLLQTPVSLTTPQVHCL